MLEQNNLFVKRHIGPSFDEINEMLETLGESVLDVFVKKIIPENLYEPINSHEDPKGEYEALNSLKKIAKKNQVYKSYIGAGYYQCKTPSVLVRNIIENPGWYTPYTPYQPEISQGRLESLFNFQTMVTDLTGLAVAGASLLDEATAVMEAVVLSKNTNKKNARNFFASDSCHPQTLAVLETRCEALDINLIISADADIINHTSLIGAVFQYPNTYGHIDHYNKAIDFVHKQGGLVTLACDLLALTLLKTPAGLGADIAVGSTQRFGCPLSYGGPHAAFFATKEIYKRKVPGRIVGLSKDSRGKKAYRLALQTREQHIRRENATSNICTAQALLANIAAMYALHHGPRGLESIAYEIHAKTQYLYNFLSNNHYKLRFQDFFDTICIELSSSEFETIKKKAHNQKINLRYDKVPNILISLDETSSWEDVIELLTLFVDKVDTDYEIGAQESSLPEKLRRNSDFLAHKVFNSYHSETELMRYIKSLESKDLSLVHSMIPLGSCTMKLNAACEMLPFTWPDFTNIHPQASKEQAKGYTILMDELAGMIKKLTGFNHVSFQPNSGAQGELTGLLVIKKYFHSRGEKERNICLIPSSAHGTNPASAVLAGLKPVVVKCNKKGGVDHDDLKVKTNQFKTHIAALMITYPSTYGVFEGQVSECCQIIHDIGGQVYLDGANFNAKLGLVKASTIGADVCHLNLHKTFCIPHGGGGPGSGPVAVRDHLAQFLPSHPDSPEEARDLCLKAVAAAKYSSANLYVIPWMFCQVMGEQGLKLASQIAILNANYIVKRLEDHYSLTFRGHHGYVAHECILDINPITQRTGVTVHDIAKRLIDYSFHAPTVSWPVVGSLMIEPTESESKEELDRFCDALISIRDEINKIEKGHWPKDNNPLKNAPHTIEELTEDSWDKPYSRKDAVYPIDSLYSNKFWAPVSRVDEAFGDRKFCCHWS